MATLDIARRYTCGNEPTVYHTITYTATRTSNTQVRYNFTVVSSFVSSSSAHYIYSGYAFQGQFTVNGATSDWVQIKGNLEDWDGSKGSKTTTYTVTATSTAAGTQSARFRTQSNGNATLYAAIMDTNSLSDDYVVTAPAMLYTANGTPGSISATPNPFESTVAVTWGASTAGTGNAVSSYELQYSTNSGSSWTNISTSIGSSTLTYNHTATSVARAGGIRYRVRARSSHGEAYYSGWRAMTANIVRNSLPNTVSTLTVTPAVFENTVSISWSGGGDPNSNLQSYTLQYSINNGSSWSAITTVNSTASSGSYSWTVPGTGTIARGASVLVRIRGNDSLGASGEWKNSSTIKKNSLPNTVSTLTATPLVFENTITINWSGGGDPDSNLASYTLQYSRDGGTNWTAITTINSTAASGSYTWTVPGTGTIARGTAVQIRIRGTDSLSQVSAAWKTFTGLTKNLLPNAPASVSIDKDSFLPGAAITVSWSGASNPNNNIAAYQVRCRQQQNGVYEEWFTASRVTSTATSGACVFNPCYLGRPGELLEFGVMTEDSLGCVSALSSNTVFTLRIFAYHMHACVKKKWIPCQSVKMKSGEKWKQVKVKALLDGVWE